MGADPISDQPASTHARFCLLIAQSVGCDYGGKDYAAEVADGVRVVAGCDTAPVLESTETTLDGIHRRHLERLCAGAAVPRSSPPGISAAGVGDAAGRRDYTAQGPQDQLQVRVGGILADAAVLSGVRQQLDEYLTIFILENGGLRRATRATGIRGSTR